MCTMPVWLYANDVLSELHATLLQYYTAHFTKHTRNDAGLPMISSDRAVPIAHGYIVTVLDDKLF